MTRGRAVIPALLCHSRSSLSFPRRRESRINISWIPFFKGMTRGKSVIPLVSISWIPFFKGMTGGSCRPRAPNYLLDPLLQENYLKIT
ncbi:MAG: hypothetical protein SFT68_02815 [Rickettsiaceae bacterium]|nr:hypothetical protein [Rickettsiaceae bacterium]